MRFVFDTNTLISAALFETSKPAQAFREARSAGEVLVSKATLGEVAVTIRRKKFDGYVSLEKRRRFLRLLVRESRMVEVAEVIRACRDPDDDKFLELAVSADASCIVSGDKDLLVLHPFRGIPILKPDAFLSWLAA